MATAVTIRDVAKHAGVGVGTVSRVLNDSASVRESTRLRVLEAIEDLNYAPSAIARRLSSGKTMAIGVAVPFFTNDSVVRRLQGIVSALSGSDYDLVLFDLERNDDRTDLLAGIAQRGLIDGLLILSVMPDENDLQRLQETGVPAVIVDGYHRLLPSVVVDDEFGAWQATRHLVELGHRQIGFLSDYPDDPFNRAPARERYAGFRRALREAGIAFRADYYLECGVDREEARQTVLPLLERADRPTAIFAFCDIQAIGILEAARELGLQVPRDLSIIGYDNVAAAEYMRLTTIGQSLFNSGVLGAELLLQIMSGQEPVDREVLLPTELVVRATTGPPP